MPDLIPFHFDAHEIRVQVDSSGDPWWIAKDVCDVLSIKNPTDALKILEPHEKALEKIEGMPYAPHGVNLINEAGLYRLIFRSNKPDAKRFQSWVFGEVLPTIRKTGKYEPTVPAIDHHPDLRAIVTLATGLAEARDIADAAKAEAHQAQLAAAQANANATRAIETQSFFTVAEYICFERLQPKIPESAYKALSDHLRLYCLDNRIPFRRIPVGGQRWDDEYGFHISVYTEVLPGWLTRRYAQGTLSIVPTSTARTEVLP